MRTCLLFAILLWGAPLAPAESPDPKRRPTSLEPPAAPTPSSKLAGATHRTDGTLQANRRGPGRTIEGRVRDAETNAPVAGARVTIESERKAWEPDADDVAVTDARGRFRIEGVARAAVHVMVRARGYTRVFAKCSAGERPVEVLLLRGATLFGTVLGPRGEPVADAVVRAEAETGRATRFLDGGRTDRSGRFELAGIEPGSYVLIARHPAFAPGMTPAVRVAALGETRSKVQLGPGIRVTGRLTDVHRRPLRGRVAVDTVAGISVPNALGEILTVETAGDGRFTLESAPAQTSGIRAWARGHAARQLPMRVGAQAVDLGDIVLDAGRTVAGIVVTTRGLPIAGARVSITPRSDALEAESDPRGRFVIAGVGAGGQRVHVTASGYAGTMLNVEPGTDARVVLHRGAVITGSAVDETGRSIDAYQIESRRQRDVHDSLEVPFPEPPQAVESADGRFALADLAPGTYQLRATAPDRGPGMVSGIVVKGGRRVDVGQIVLPAGGVLRGVVSDVHDAPVVGAAVSVGVGAWGPAAPDAVSDVSGRFELRGVAPGPAAIVARHPSFAPALVECAEVDPGQGSTEVQVVMHAGARVEGVVRHRDATATTSRSVEVHPLGRQASRMGTAVDVALDGSFVLKHLPPGPAHVRLVAREGGRVLSTQQRAVELHEGETVSLEFQSRGIPITGHVLLGGAPAAGYTVTFAGSATRGSMPALGERDAASAPQRLFARVRDDGAYVLLLDDAGKYGVRVQSADGRIALPWREVTIPEVDSYALDLEFAAAALTGSVVDAQTEELVPGATLSVIGVVQGTASQATTGADGRFHFELDPGRYDLTARSERHGQAHLVVSLGTAGEDVRVRLSHGAALRGRLVDAGGRAIPDVTVLARDSETRELELTRTLRDGSFLFPTLSGRSYALCGGSALSGFAVRSSVVPSGEDVVLKAQASGQVHLSVRGPDGAPLSDVAVQIDTVDGAAVACPLPQRRSDVEGILDAAMPPGEVQLKVSKGPFGKRLSLRVSEGGTVPAEVMLSDGR